MIDHTHDPSATSWVPGADDHADFPVQNLPLGLFSTASGAPRIGMAIGDHVLDLAGLADDSSRNALTPADSPPQRKGAGYGGTTPQFQPDGPDIPDGVSHPHPSSPERRRGFTGSDPCSLVLTAAVRTALAEPTLNALFALPNADRLALRQAVFALLTSKLCRTRITPHLHAAGEVTMHVPARIGDYSDFYVGIHHAANIGKLLRPDNPLLASYKHVPIGYHGRASSVRVSDTPVLRPRGQIKPPGADAPLFEPCRRLDYELELGVWIAGSNALGAPVPIAAAGKRVAGLSLLNDLSARDIQVWEYQPLGPFLAKSFLTTVSPWVVTAEALAPFRQPQPPRPAGDPAPLPYLWDEADQREGAWAIKLEAHIATAAMRAAGLAPYRLSRGDAGKAMYWTVAQMIAHHTSNGCDLNPGDLLGTGTLSGPAPGSFGSLMEIGANGAAPVTLPSGETRGFLGDGDELTLTARAAAPGRRSIGFGAARGVVYAAP